MIGGIEPTDGFADTQRHELLHRVAQGLPGNVQRLLAQDAGNDDIRFIADCVRPAEAPHRSVGIP